MILFVQAKNVYPQLLLARLFFSIGGSATSTMVTAIFPSMLTPREPTSPTSPSGPSIPSIPININGHGASPSVSSELTITPIRFHDRSSRSLSPSDNSVPRSSPTRLAGFVGLFTGCGALLALALFLPLPALIQKSGLPPGKAVANTYCIVGVIALMVSIICFFGLRNLQGEEGKGWHIFIAPKKPDDPPSDGESNSIAPASTLSLVLESIKLGYIYPQLGLGYLGGFVARASSVGISLFIPLFVNSHFIRSGLCSPSGLDPQHIKESCQEAYILAAKLTGISQLVALMFAPVFGYWADKHRRFNVPLLTAAFIGIVGYLGLSVVKGPEPGENSGYRILLIVAMLGIAQIGAIVCSLGIVGSCVLRLDLSSRIPGSENMVDHAAHVEYDALHRARVTSIDPLLPRRPITENAGGSEEFQELLPNEAGNRKSYNDLKGSIAGVYSLAGGAGILLLTKAGGLAFDRISPVAPFYILALFNSLLLIAGVARAISAAVRS